MSNDPSIFHHDPHSPLSTLLTRNTAWRTRTLSQNPSLFPTLAASQAPSILWLGCSDSRVPETTILDLLPGEVFVHRNIANLLPATDMSSQAVLQYAVESLEVQHVIVCGHYGCGGVAAALQGKSLGMLDCWLRGIRDVKALHAEELKGLHGEEERRRLVELNVEEQVKSVKRNACVQEAVRERGMSVQGWVYEIADGGLKVLCECEEEEEEDACYEVRRE